MKLDKVQKTILIIIILFLIFYGFSINISNFHFYYKGLFSIIFNL
jgi:hypothetical protein